MNLISPDDLEDYKEQITSLIEEITDIEVSKYSDCVQLIAFSEALSVIAIQCGLTLPGVQEIVEKSYNNILRGSV